MKKVYILFFLFYCVVLVNLVVFAETLNTALEKYRQGNLEEAFTDFQIVFTREEEKPKAKELAREYFATCTIELGNKYLQTGDYQKALNYLEKAINLLPENTEIKNLYQTIKEKSVTVIKPLPSVTPTQQLVPQPPVVVPQPPAAVKQPVTEIKQPPETVLQSPAVVTQPPKVVSPPATKKEERKKLSVVTVPQPTKKTTPTVTEVVLPITKRIETKKPTTIIVTKEKLKALEEKIIFLNQNYEQQREELLTKLNEKDKLLKRTILYALLILLFFAFLSQYGIKRTISKSTTEKILISQGTVSLPDEKKSEEIFFDWLNSLENKVIVQIITVLLNSPEENVRAKGFEFLEKILKRKEFTPEEQWKVERTIRKIGLEEGWITK